MKLGMSLIMTVLLVAIVGRPELRRAESVNSVGWDREGAAKYLDERMDLWFSNAKKLRTGEAETTCVSCHTSVPYVIARPALRRSMHVLSATPQETRLLEETRRRVENYSAIQPLYESNDSKKKESRGTEAVLNTLILASADAAQIRHEPDGSTRQAFGWLWKNQQPDGAWDWLNFGLEPFETVDARYYGATLAALAIGFAPGLQDNHEPETRTGVSRLRAYLKEKYASQGLFNRVWILLASTRMKDLLTSAERGSLITEIQKRQKDDGGWSMESLGDWRWSKTAAPFEGPGKLDASLLARSDGYATGLIVYTLKQAGRRADQPAIKKGLQWLRANQQKVEVGENTWQAWRAHSLNYDREHGGEKGEPWRRLFMSDAATAFAVLALAEVN